MQSNKNQNIGGENWLSTSLPPPLTVLCLHGLLYQWYSSSLVPKKILERNTAEFAAILVKKGQRACSWLQILDWHALSRQYFWRYLVSQKATMSVFTQRLNLQ